MNAIVTPLVGVPQFKLTTGNSTVEPRMKADIDSIEMAEDVNLPAMLQFKLNMWDGNRQRLNEDYLEQMELGTPLELAIGINDTTPIFTGEVTALEPEFGGNDKGDSLNVRAYNRLYRLQFGTHQRTFENMSASEIASSIADELGLIASVDDSSVKHSHITQNNQNNLRFLLDLAKPINYEVFVEDKTLYFRKSQETQGQALTLTYRRDLIEFMPRQRALPQGGKVEVRGWDVKNKQPILGTGGPGDETSKMGGQKSGAEISAAAFESATRTITHQAVADAEEATQIAKAWYNLQQANFIEAQGECAGSPLLRAGHTIKILEVGKAFSGIYYVTSATHNIGPSGYLTRFKVRRNAL
jgi:phage protein D